MSRRCVFADYALSAVTFVGTSVSHTAASDAADAAAAAAADDFLIVIASSTFTTTPSPTSHATAISLRGGGSRLHVAHKT